MSLQEDNRKRRKRRRRKRILHKLACILLLLVAVLCAGGMLYTGRLLVTKKEEEQKQAKAASAAKAQEEEQKQAEDAREPEPTKAPEPTEEPAEAEKSTPSQVMAGDMVFQGGYTAKESEQMEVPPKTEVLSANSLLLDLSSNTILAAKDATARIYPASMTKIMTVLVAAEHVSNLDDTFTMTSDITGYCLTNGCSAAGFVGGETIPVRDLFYGTILPSGGEAAVGLATYVAGSQEAFVELMNAKLQELGLSETAHFTNCVGIYDDNHYCTALDMAMILKAAVENDVCREVLSAHVYTTSLTEQNPEGIILSNWFLRRIEDKDCGGEVLCAKTGFVAQSGDCAASYEISASGKPYICVTVNTYSNWRCIYDHVAMYQRYAK